MARITTKTVKKGPTGTQTVKTSKRGSALPKADTRVKTAQNLGTKGLAIASEAIAGDLSKHSISEKERTNRENQRQKTYQAALSKWNGIIKSTPENAEGTGEPMGGVAGIESTDSYLGSNWTK